MDAAENRAVDNLVDKIDNIIGQINSYNDKPRPYVDLYRLVKSSLPLLPDIQNYSFFVWANVSGTIGGKYQFQYQSDLTSSHVIVQAPGAPAIEYYVSALFKILYSTRVKPVGRPGHIIAANNFSMFDIPLS